MKAPEFCFRSNFVLLLKGYLLSFVKSLGTEVLKVNYNFIFVFFAHI